MDPIHPEGHKTIRDLIKLHGWQRLLLALSDHANYVDLYDLSRQLHSTALRLAPTGD